MIEWKRFGLLLIFDAIMHARCRVHRSRERWKWLLVLINYTINIRIFVCKRTNALTNEYPNIRDIRFSTNFYPWVLCFTFWLARSLKNHCTWPSAIIKNNDVCWTYQWLYWSLTSQVPSFWTFQTLVWERSRGISDRSHVLHCSAALSECELRMAAWILQHSKLCGPSGSLPGQ